MEFMLKGILRRSIEHSLKKHKDEKLGFSKINKLEKNFFFLFPKVFIFAFYKNMNPRLCILSLVDKFMT